MVQKAKTKSSARAKPSVLRTRHATIGANFMGAGSGTALLYLLKGLPGDRPWKQYLLYFAPAFSLAVRRGVLWLVGLIGWYVRRKWEDQQRVWDYNREIGRLEKGERALGKILERPNLTAETRQEVMKALAEIDTRRIEAVRRMNAPAID